MLFTAELIKYAIVALFAATTFTASHVHASLEAQEEAALAAEQDWEAFRPKLPNNSYELSLGLQQIAFTCSDDQVVKRFWDMFPGRIALKQFTAPISGIMIRSEDMWEIPFLHVESGTPMFEIRSNGEPHVMVALKDIVIGRWLVEHKMQVRKGDVIVEYYTLATAEEERVALRAQKQGKTEPRDGLVAKEATEISVFAPPKDTYELSLSLQQLAYACGEYRAASVLLSMFPGQLTVNRLKAPTSGVMTKGEDIWAPYVDASRGTVVFAIKSVSGAVSEVTPPKDVVIGHWSVSNGESVTGGDSVVEYYTIAKKD